ncbi:glycosyltransferase family 4 protein [Algoriphagus persicinus]|uniref:glycosyltransferase family 4 protein n=1 Tax=Algoriphagus persicinus TaxID=3108754 RepID=UPI002B37B774|nr:glycosyltransferase family 4 protein [Algoriphagus sp. E1-3-M2]MEB2786967.1 glycosyltransferase family 4 protein [Algoriphagus sp. E1-3-M2]
MKILHCCLAQFYIDDFGYQENILPKFHSIYGFDVKIVASTETYINNNKLGYVPPKSYKTMEGIPITRIPYVSYLPHFLGSKLRIYKGLFKLVSEFNPDIIFLHDVQFISVIEIIKFAKKHNVKIYADCHTDYMNSAKNWLSKYILHKIIYKWCTKSIEPFVVKFWGVTPSRRKFLTDFYGVDKNKVDLLVMGVDDSSINFKNKELISIKIRTQLKIDKKDFVIISGGKIVRRKNIHLLMKAVNELNLPDLKLIVFGSTDSEMKEEIDLLSLTKHISYVGWKNSEEINDLFFSANLAFFPGAHSVLWEQAVGLGLPSVFQKWEGYDHVDIGGNCIFINEISVDSLKKTILKILNEKDLYLNMMKIASEKGIQEFSYSKISMKAIQL